MKQELRLLTRSRIVARPNPGAQAGDTEDIFDIRHLQVGIVSEPSQA